jgi:hypothetical protein
VNVGIVRAVDRTSSGAVVRIVLMRGVGFMGRDPLVRGDAQVAIRPRIFREGAYFLDLDPGTSEAPALKAGSRIPATQTRAPRFP